MWVRRGEAVAAPPCPAEPRASCRVRSCCSTTRCRASCRSGSKGWRRTARAWTSALVRPAAAGAPAWPRAFGARSLSGPQLARLLGGACKRTCSAVSAGTGGKQMGKGTGAWCTVAAQGSPAPCSVSRMEVSFQHTCTCRGHRVRSHRALGREGSVILHPRP